MKKLTIILGIALLASFSITMAQKAGPSAAHMLARNWIQFNPFNDNQILSQQTITDNEGSILAYQHDLYPRGYIIVTNDLSLPPVIAYSFTSDYTHPEQDINPLQEILIADLRGRYEYIPDMDTEQKNQNREKWDALLSGAQDRNGFEQWPPGGSTITGGWLETNWKQSAPYNNFCPLDEVTGNRSIAGCPALALAMIINYQKSLHGIQFSDDDDYYHNYAGRQYWIDDDSHPMEFPAFPELNQYFDSITEKFLSYETLNTNEMAALVFACGVAAKQVYTSEVSGTFGVDQAYDAYMRLAYDDAMLIYDSDTSFYTHMKNNMKEGIPVHLALLVDGAGGGHNVVTDGYNTDDYYHLNFGWGGSYNGWYLIPDEIPYNLTIVEGAIMDIGVSHVGIHQPIEVKTPEFSIFPNPSQGILNINIELDETSNVRIEIYDCGGKLIEQVYTGNLNTGHNHIEWEHKLAGGIYNVGISMGGLIQTKKLIVLK